MGGPPGRHQQDLGWMVQHCRTGRDGRAGTFWGAISVSWDCVYVLSERENYLIYFWKTAYYIQCVTDGIQRHNTCKKARTVQMTDDALTFIT